MRLRHATTLDRLESIKANGFLVSMADSSAKIKGCWFHTKSASPWAVLHTIRKHKADLADVVVIEVEVSRSQLTRFRTGLWYTKVDVPASSIKNIYAGSDFGASAQ